MVTAKRSRATSLLALLSVVFLLATACSDDGGGEASTETTAAATDDGATTTTAPADAEPPSESAAASLHSDLVGLFEEQVYLTGFTVQAGVAGGGVDAPEAVAFDTQAAAAADELANLFGGAYGVVAGSEVVAALNDHRDAVVGYALNADSADAVALARDDLVAAFEAMDPDADFSTVATGLESSDTALLRTVDELVAEQPAAAVDLREAAESMPDVALALAETVADHAQTEGEVDSPEAALRAELTGLMQESALLTSLLVAETVQADGDAGAPGPAGVRTAVDENTADLADAIDTASSEEFVQLWSGHVDSFVDYTTAILADDAEGIQASQDALVQFRDDVGELLAEDHPGFTKEQVAEELVDHTESILAVADAFATDPASGPPLVREAAQIMRLAARSLTAGLTAPAATVEDEAATTTTEA